MMYEGAEASYSRVEMLAAGAQLLGRPVSYRLLVDWVELGLVPAPKCTYPGWAKGRRGFWTAAGFDLWKTQLQNRQRQVSIGAMCNLPVGIWVYYEGNPIEMPHVRRAMRTWAQRAMRSRNGLIVKNANDFVRRLGHQPVNRKAKKTLIKLLQTRPWERSVDRERLRRALTEVIAPGQSGGSGKPLSAKWIAESSELGFLARWAGVHRLPVDYRDDGRDRDLIRARAALCEAAPGYELDRRRWSAHPVYGKFFRDGGIGRRIGAACGELTQFLGKLALEGEGVVRQVS